MGSDEKSLLYSSIATLSAKTFCLSNGTIIGLKSNDFSPLRAFLIWILLTHFLRNDGCLGWDNMVNWDFWDLGFSLSHPYFEFQVNRKLLPTSVFQKTIFHLLNYEDQYGDRVCQWPLREMRRGLWLTDRQTMSVCFAKSMLQWHQPNVHR